MIKKDTLKKIRELVIHKMGAIFPTYIFIVIAVTLFLDPSANPIIQTVSFIISAFFIIITLISILKEFIIIEIPFIKALQEHSEKISNYFSKILTKRQKKLKRIDWERLVLSFLFVVIPLLFLPMLMNNLGSIEEKSFVGPGKFLGETGLNMEEKMGVVKVDNQINFSSLETLSILVGRGIDFSIVDVCFSNTNISPKRAKEETFNSTVILDNKEQLEVPFLGEVCVPYDPTKDSMSYKWQTKIEVPIIWKNSTEESIPLYSGHPQNEVYIKTNTTNLWLVFILLLFAWWTLLTLFFRVIRYLYKGFEFNKNE